MRRVSRRDKTGYTLEQALYGRGIHKLPFPIEEVDDFYFATPRLAKQSDALRNLVEFGDLILVVSGVEGAGKTAFLNQLLLSADSRWRVARIEAREVTSLDRLVEALLSGFGIRLRGDDAPGDESLLRTFLTEVHAGGNVAMAVVDDAHLLPQICNEYLLALAGQRGYSNLRLLLTTEPGRLGFATNDPQRVHVVVLQPFDLQQCGDYIQARLRYAGLVGDNPFDAATVEAIHQDARGVPAAIHPLALHALLAAADAPPRPRRRHLLRRRPLALAAVLLVACVAGAWLLQTEPARLPRRADDPGSAGLVRGRVEGLASGPAAAAGNAGTAAAAAPAPLVASALSRGSRGDAPGPPAGTVPAPMGAGIVGPKRGAPALAMRPAVAVTSEAPGKDNSALPAARLAGNVTPAVVTTPHDLDWLRTQDPSHYVLQLVGTRDPAAVARFLDEHGLGAAGAWFETSHEDRRWYVVVYGMYPDRAAARAAIATLPEALRAGSPWPRTVGSIVESAR